MSHPSPVQFWFSIGSTYTYLTVARLDAVEAACGLSFEWRPFSVRAIMLESKDSKERNVKFRVEARLNLEPAPEVAFDTVLELTTGHYSIQQTAS